MLFVEVSFGMAQHSEERVTNPPELYQGPLPSAISLSPIIHLDRSMQLYLPNDLKFKP